MRGLVGDNPGGKGGKEQRSSNDPRHRRHHRQARQARGDPAGVPRQRPRRARREGLHRVRRRGRCRNALPIQTRWGPDTFLAIEKWETMEALKAHAAAPHMAAYGAKTKEMI